MTKTLSAQKPQKSIKDFLGYNVFVIAAFLLPAFIVTACFIINRIEPFGKNIVMVSDAWQQYYPFLRELQMLLKEGELPLYSWNTGGGANFLGVVSNYLGSPLNLFTVFLPLEHVWLESYLAITIILRIGCAGSFMAIFLRKAFRRNDLSLVYFSLMYALCGFIMGYYWNVMWLDSVAFLPLVVAGVVGVLRDKEYLLYVVALAFSVICNFYIGYVVCIFVLLFCVGYTIVEFKSLKESFKNFGKMAGLTLIAFMLTAFITVPAFLALKSSDSMSDVSSFPIEYSINSAYGYVDNSFINSLSAFFRTLTNTISFTRPISMDKGEPNIFCSSLAVVLGVFYLTSKKIKLREKVVSVSFLLFLTLSFIVNQLNYIWHGFNIPAMVYYRFSFLFSFVLIIMAYRAFEFAKDFGKKSICIVTAVLACYLMLAFVFQRKISVVITFAVIAVIMVLLILHKTGKLSFKLLSLLLSLIVLCDMSVSALYSTRFVGFYKGQDYPNQYESVKILTENAREQNADNELYRTEFVRPFSLNDGALYSEFGVSSFNSMCREDYTDFFTEFGLQASKANNTYLYVESTPVTNLFLNIKYLIARENRNADPEDEPVIIYEEITDDSDMKLIAEEKGSKLYENQSYLPMGFMTKSELLDYKLSESARLPHNTQNEIFKLATGTNKDVLIPVKADKLSGADLSPMTRLEDLDTYYVYKHSSAENEVLTVEYTAPETGRYYGIFRNSSKEKFQIRCGERTVWDLDNYVHITSLGTVKQGESVRVDLPVVETDNGRLGYYLFYLDEEVYNEGFEKLSQSTMTMDEKSHLGFKGHINAKEDGLFYTSVLFDEGWRAFVDGKEVEITPVADTFCAFELSEGEYLVEFKFFPPGLWAGVTVTLLGLTAFAFVAVSVKVRRKRKS